MQRVVRRQQARWVELGRDGAPHLGEHVAPRLGQLHRADVGTRKKDLHHVADGGREHGRGRVTRPLHTQTAR
eukprot:7334292-Prymnesium_polylepis.1